MNKWSFDVQYDCIKALNELSRMKVCKIRNDDQEENFADVWRHVKHEIDTFEEGEYDWREDKLLTPSTHKTAKKWLEKYRYLYKKYDNNK